LGNATTSYDLPFAYVSSEKIEADERAVLKVDMWEEYIKRKMENERKR
jgi:hypothetical protein